MSFLGTSVCHAPELAIHGQNSRDSSPELGIHARNSSSLPELRNATPEIAIIDQIHSPNFAIQPQNLHFTTETPTHGRNSAIHHQNS